MVRPDDIWEMWRLQTRTAQMMTEANLVISMRLLGMGGLWPVAQTETRRMVDEKGPAFAEAGMLAWQAAMTGAAPAVIASAWLDPIGRRTSSNMRRLARRRTR